MITIDQLVPSNHLVVKLEMAIVFSFMYDLVEDMNSEVGHPGMVQLLFSITASNPIKN
ncbi:hypothetical protein J7J00_25635 [Bacillus sp. ISL-4]|uniref:hypothetical protein n=1 Tax=Bacillus sp. ISL-4 TaxID=2819125 RepID=UPI001BE54D4E|nr:hypothetical protein [Bacillus sp. ISL-4]MBT2668790.1 hypothetical protein [Bacillus sp. ISL-4]